MTGIRVLRPGMLSTVQDLGRIGLQHLGIVVCGAMDPVAHRLANALVGNQHNEATLEITLIGAELEFDSAALIAFSGARFEATINGHSMPQDRPVLIEAGTRIQLGRAVHGARGYLAIAGGLALAPIMGSRSTYLPAGFGGLLGRALQTGDLLPLTDDADQIAAQRFARLLHASQRVVEGPGFRSVRWSAPPLTLPDRNPIAIMAMPGLHFNLFSEPMQREFFDTVWRVTPESNRIGYRLDGPELQPRQAGEILSGPTCLGTVQVPPSGLPIVLMADHQTTGGYPKIAEVASADAIRLGQVAPGARLRFVRCTLDEAVKARRSVSARTSARRQGIEWEYLR